MEVVEMNRYLFANIRKLSGMNQYEFAAILGISRSLVAKIEIGNREITPDIRYKVTQEFGEDVVVEVARIMKRITKIDVEALK